MKTMLMILMKLIKLTIMNLYKRNNIQNIWIILEKEKNFIII